MNKPLIAITLFAATASVVAFHPAAEPPSVSGTATPTQPVAQPPAVATRRIEVVFALDTTGSMSGLLEAAKEKVWSIASTMAQAEPAPEIRMGLVAYRDRGDDYVTRVVDLSEDLDSVYATLMDFRAAGGGDGPEAVNQALAEAVDSVSWSQGEDVYRVVFLVGDAPPHMDYQGERQYPEIVAAARARGILVNAIRCGTNAATGKAWRHIAELSQGDFFDVGQDGSAVALVSPFDEKLASLSAEVDATRMVYGSSEEKSRFARKKEATAALHAAASPASRARRAAFNASAAGARNFLGDNDLVSEFAEGHVDLATLADDELPEPIAAMAPAEREAAVRAEAAKRDELVGRISELAEQRDAWLKEKVAADGGRADSLDAKIHATVRRQAAAHGLELEDAPKY